MKWALGYIVLELLLLLFFIMIMIPLIRWMRQRRMTQKRPNGLHGFEQTDEIFVDPTTGMKQRVWYNPETGERYYETLNPPD